MHIPLRNVTVFQDIQAYLSNKSVLFGFSLSALGGTAGARGRGCTASKHAKSNSKYCMLF